MWFMRRILEAWPRKPSIFSLQKDLDAPFSSCIEVTAGDRCWSLNDFRLYSRKKSTSCHKQINRCWDISCFSGNGAARRCQRGILIYVVNEEILGRFEPPARLSPRFYGDTRTNPRNSSFELIQRFTVPTRRGLIAYRSKDKIDISEYKSLSSISDKSSVLGYRMVSRDAQASASFMSQPGSGMITRGPGK
jgi:hypothetical protein